MHGHVMQRLRPNLCAFPRYHTPDACSDHMNGMCLHLTALAPLEWCRVIDDKIKRVPSTS